MEAQMEVSCCGAAGNALTPATESLQSWRRQGAQGREPKMPERATWKGLWGKRKGGLVMLGGEITAGKVQEVGKGKGGALAAHDSLEGAPRSAGGRGGEPPARVESGSPIPPRKLVANGSCLDLARNRRRTRALLEDAAPDAPKLLFPRSGPAAALGGIPALAPLGPGWGNSRQRPEGAGSRREEPRAAADLPQTCLPARPGAPGRAIREEQPYTGEAGAILGETDDSFGQQNQPGPTSSRLSSWPCRETFRVPLVPLPLGLASLTAKWK